MPYNLSETIRRVNAMGVDLVQNGITYSLLNPQQWAEIAEYNFNFTHPLVSSTYIVAAEINYEAETVADETTLHILDGTDVVYCRQRNILTRVKDYNRNTTRVKDYRENITRLELPDSLKAIGNCCFLSCQKLTEAELPKNLQNIGYMAFEDTAIEQITIPTMVRSVPDGVFSNCTKLESVVLSEGVKEIQVQAFSNCLSLEHLQLPSTLTSIDSLAFQYCPKLKKVSIPHRVRKLPANAFSQFQYITELHLPKHLARHVFLVKACRGVPRVKWE